MNKSLEAYLIDLDMPLAFRLRAFYERYCSADDEAYLHLAAHAAFPIAITPDLLYKIWLNFTKDAEGKDLEIPYIAVSDLLLSSLYRATGRNTFEMPDGIRKLLLHYLRENVRFGTEREDELAHFLRAYLQENPQAIPSEAFRRAQEFIVKVRLEPDIAAEELLKAYSQVKNAGQLQNWLNLAEGELELQQPAKDGQKNPLAVAAEFVRGVQEYKRGNKEQGLELLERLKGRLSKGENGGIRVPLGQRILEKLPKEMNLGEDERPVFLGVFNSSESSTRPFEEKYRIIRALESVKELNSIALVDKTWKELNSIGKSFKEQVLIFHFAGHAGIDQLVFEDSSINPNQLADFLAQFPNLKLVFLNSMRSERFIEKLVESGIPVVLATYGDITDSQAISFAHDFYEHLAVNNGLSDAKAFAVNKNSSLKLDSEFIDFRGFKPGQTTYYLYHKFEHDEQWKLIDAIQLFFEQQRATKQAKKEDKVFPAQLNKIPFLKEGEVCLGRLGEIKLLDSKVKNQKSPVFIVGKQGVGKTTLLRAYIHQHHGSFKHILWINLNAGLGESVTTDPDLIKLIEGQEADSTAKKYESFIKLVTLLNTISGPNLLIIDSAKEKLETKKIIDLLPNEDNWKTIISSRINKGFNPIVINPLNNEAALKLFSSHCQDGADTEKYRLVKLLGYMPDQIILVAKFLNQFKGSLSILGLLSAAKQKKFNIHRIAEFLSKSPNNASLAIKIKNWLELNGEKEIIQGAVLKHLNSNAEGLEINQVLVAWLNTNGNPSFIVKGVKRYLDQYASEIASGIVLFFWVEKTRKIKDVEVYLKKHLDLHADKKETCNLMVYWLMYGGEPKAIKPLVKKHLDRNGQNEPSFKLLSVWLGASKDIELVRDNVIKALSQNLGAEQIVLIVTAWLEAGGELDVVHESVQLFMRLGPMELLSSNVIQSWLRAKGDTTVVEEGVVRYLGKFARQKETVFLITLWLDVGGSKEPIQNAIFEYLRTNAEHVEAIFVIQAWLQAGGDRVTVQDALVKFLSADTAKGSKGVPMAIHTWLETVGDKKIIQDGLIRYLQQNVIDPEAAIVFSSWLNAGGDKTIIQDSLKEYLILNAEQPDAQFVLCAWLNAGGDKAFVQESIIRYLRVNGVEKEAALVISAWLVAIGKKETILEFLMKFLLVNASKPEARYVLKAWLDAGGDRAMVHDAWNVYLEHHIEQPESAQILAALVRAQEPIESLIKWLQIYSNKFDTESEAIRLALESQQRFNELSEKLLYDSEYYSSLSNLTNLLNFLQSEIKPFLALETSKESCEYAEIIILDLQLRTMRHEYNGFGKRIYELSEAIKILSQETTNEILSMHLLNYSNPKINHISQANTK